MISGETIYTREVRRRGTFGRSPQGTVASSDRGVHQVQQGRNTRTGT